MGVATASALLDRLRSLTPPRADRSTVSRYLQGLGNQISLLTQFATAIETNDSRVITLNQRLQEGKATVQGWARAYGLRICSSDG